jgi:citrate lyase synthetase
MDVPMAINELRALDMVSRFVGEEDFSKVTQEIPLFP